MRFKNKIDSKRKNEYEKYLSYELNKKTNR